MELIFPDRMTAADFLRSYWQKKPLLLPGAVRDFNCPLGPEELAGLACEPEIESRIVIQNGGHRPWEVRYGPFKEASFARLPASHWTLLVQDVDKHVDEVGTLLDAFTFLPDWRLDDIMISYAADQGSVGPHIDEYDVFLLQASGRRRWRIHTRPVPESDYIPELQLRILPEFEAQQEWLLEPGDMLYLPPRVAHWGIAEGDDCMTCSIGFRAPDYHEMAADWCDDIIRRQVPEGRYTDGELKPQSHRGEITRESLSNVDRLLESLLQQDEASRARWFGRFITEPKPHLQVSPRSETLTEADFTRRCMRQPALLRNNWSRFAYIRGDSGVDYLYSNGQEYPLPAELGGFLTLIGDHRRLAQDRLHPWLDIPDCRTLLTRLYNAGHLRFDDE